MPNDHIGLGIDRDMFDLPDVKRVKRTNILENSSSSESDSNNSFETSGEARATIDYGFDYDYFEPPNRQSNQQPAVSESKPPRAMITDPDSDSDGHAEAFNDDTKPVPPHETTYDFVLFQPQVNRPGESKPVEQKFASRITIRSRSPTPSPSAGRIVKPRPQHHYFTAVLPEETIIRLHSEYAQAALSGPQVLRLKGRAYPGASLPWRVVHIPGSRLIKHPSQNQSISQQLNVHDKTQRTRPSKKRRIKLRQKLQARQAAREQATAHAKDVELAEREKRTRRNREKKVKKKERDKKKKLAERTGDTSAVPDAVNKEILSE